MPFYKYEENSDHQKEDCPCAQYSFPFKNFKCENGITFNKYMKIFRLNNDGDSELKTTTQTIAMKEALNFAK